MIYILFSILIVLAISSLAYTYYGERKGRKNRGKMIVKRWNNNDHLTLRETIIRMRGLIYLWLILIGIYFLVLFIFYLWRV